MKHIETKLAIIWRHHDDEITKELIYRGNENITIKYTSKNKEISINIPRNALEQFLEIIKC